MLSVFFRSFVTQKSEGICIEIAQHALSTEYAWRGHIWATIDLASAILNNIH